LAEAARLLIEAEMVMRLMMPPSSPFPRTIYLSFLIEKTALPKLSDRAKMANATGNNPATEKSVTSDSTEKLKKIGLESSKKLS
jgi:hypothetical protein